MRPPTREVSEVPGAPRKRLGHPVIAQRLAPERAEPTPRPPRGDIVFAPVPTLRSARSARAAIPRSLPTDLVLAKGGSLDVTGLATPPGGNGERNSGRKGGRSFGVSVSTHLGVTSGQPNHLAFYDWLEVRILGGRGRQTTQCREPSWVRGPRTRNRGRSRLSARTS